MSELSPEAKCAFAILETEFNQLETALAEQRSNTERLAKRVQGMERTMTRLRVTIDMIHDCGLEHFPSIHSCRCKEAIEDARKL